MGIGWTGPADNAAWQGHGSAQSLPRELSMAKDKSLLQTFVVELQSLREKHQQASGGDPAIAAGLQVEVLASFPSSCIDAGQKCTVSILGDGGGAAGATKITLWADKQLVLVDATSQGNSAVHAIADHAIVELIVNNATAFVVYAYPNTTTGNV